jgi:peroxiredoxin
MNGRTVAVLGLVAAAAAAMALNLSCTKSNSEPKTSEKRGWDGDPATLFASHRGQVLLLLAGMEGCPGTRAATEVLKEYAAQKPAGVSIVRLDVPPPGGKLSARAGDPLPFAYGTDKDRVVAGQLGFFFYPTFYIFDRDGELRFSGGCDKETLPQMVSEILAERPGDPKHVYTPPLPAEGTQAPAFTGKTLDGKTVTLDELRGGKATVMIFAETGCAFSMAAIPGMKELQDSLQDKQVAVVIINKREAADAVRPIYEERAPGMTVVADDKCEIAEAYGVSPVPFCFVLDENGAILQHMPYTQEAARSAVDFALGVTPAAPGGAQPGAG